jgi:hypothetical protein
VDIIQEVCDLLEFPIINVGGNGASFASRAEEGSQARRSLFIACKILTYRPSRNAANLFHTSSINNYNSDITTQPFLLQGILPSKG